MCTSRAALAALFIATLLFTVNQDLEGQESPRTGAIQGRVAVEIFDRPLTGVAVNVVGQRSREGVASAVTDDEGVFELEGIPVGSYTLIFRSIGYRQRVITDVIVRSSRITFVNADMEVVPVRLDEIVVEGGYFPAPENQPVSITSISREEIRRSPGSAGDISRVVMALPSVAKVSDQMNALAVRGGSPSENSFYLDNIEVPNINHFPSQGASGGPIGMLNVDFIDGVEFRAGAFGAEHGNRMSSVMDITLREGNREEFDGQFDFNLAGVGFQGEGPLAGGNGSWMFSARRSFLDLIFAAVDPEAVQVPEYSDYQGKIAFDLSETQKLSLLGIWGVDAILSDSAGAFDNRIDVYGDIGIHEGAIGMNLRSLWPGAVSNTSLAYGENYWSVLMFRTTGGQSLMDNVTTERWFSFRNVNSVDIGHGGNVLSFGAEVKHNFADYNVVFPAFVNFTGDSVAERTFVTDLTGQNIGGYVEFHLKPASGVAVTLGARGDHYTVTGNTHLSPRGSITFSLTDRTSITASTGLYYQDLPSVLLAQDPAFRNLEPPRSIHYVLGLSHLLTDDTRLMVEAYRKDVSRMPIDPLAPGMFVFDEVILGANTFLNHPTLTDVGEARSMGVELTVQKRLARDLYGLASASYSIAEYLGGDAIWRDRIYDNRLRIGFEGGYKPNEKWEFSGRWLFATGAPYTPIDTVQSAVHKWTVLDDTNVNGARYPNYHSLNLRFDRRFNYRRTNMVLFLSIWNVYNRQNVGAYFWNGIDNEVTTFYQWTMLPILGIEFEF